MATFRVTVQEAITSVGVTTDVTVLSEQVTGIQGPIGLTPVISSAVPALPAVSIAIGTRTFTVDAGCAFAVGQVVRVASATTQTRYMAGPVISYSGTTLVISSQETSGTGTLGAAVVSITGVKGESGSSGVVSVTSPITNAGTSSAAIIGINQSLLAIAPTQVTGTAAVLNTANAFTIGGHTITNATTTVIPLLVKGAASQFANLQDWQNSAGTPLASVNSGGGFNAVTIGTANNNISLVEEQNGGRIRLTKMTATATNPGANLMKIYVRDGTNAGTLKLVVRAGAAGAETTILDNIPQ